MRVHFLTIALDAMPFITWHLPVFNQLKIPWKWTICEGYAKPILDTAWCKPMEPRLSKDGTSEYLGEIAIAHPRINLYRRKEWQGKVEMVNTALSDIREPCVLMQVDSDELWLPGQITTICNMLMTPTKQNCASFPCRYFVGPNLVITSDGTYGNRGEEWRRAWKFEPGMKFLKHEPPILEGEWKSWTREETRKMGLAFAHYAYAMEKQLAFKEQYYGYTDAVKNWRRLQAHDKFPCRLGDFLPWVQDDAVVDRLYKP